MEGRHWQNYQQQVKASTYVGTDEIMTLIQVTVKLEVAPHYISANAEVTSLMFSSLVKRLPSYNIQQCAAQR